MLTFAYGSNLNLTAYADRGFRAELLRPAGRAWLPDHELRFSRRSQRTRSGVLNVAPRVGAAVAGMLFEVLGDGWADLDLKEGHPDAYRRERVVVLDQRGAEVECAAYIAPQSGIFPPSDEYLSVVRQGMTAFDVDGVAMLEAAARGGPAPTGVAGVFVYGTLLPGELRAHYLAGQPSRPARMQGRLLDCGSYPALVDGEGWVQGALVELQDPSSILPVIDRVEGFPGFGAPRALFRRTLAIAEGEGHGRVRTWVYRFAGAANFPVIEGGSWRERAVLQRNGVSSTR